jgi:hypothetical protein
MPTTCGTGECESTGQTICIGGAEGDTCTPGPQDEPTDVTCDGLDGDGVPEELDNCREVFNPDQRDSNSNEDDNTQKPGDQHYGDACDTDYDNNGFVGLEDFNDLRTCFGNEASPGCEDIDCDGSGFIGLEDFNCLRTYFGGPPGPGIGD